MASPSPKRRRQQDDAWGTPTKGVAGRGPAAGGADAVLRIAVEGNIGMFPKSLPRFRVRVTWPCLWPVPRHTSSTSVDQVLTLLNDTHSSCIMHVCHTSGSNGEVDILGHPARQAQGHRGHPRAPLSLDQGTTHETRDARQRHARN